jgi:hypothetical protein
MGENARARMAGVGKSAAGFFTDFHGFTGFKPTADPTRGDRGAVGVGAVGQLVNWSTRQIKSYDLFRKSG